MCRESADGGCCRPAVQRAYTEMRSKGQPEQYCYEAALEVYRWHHPETPAAQADAIVTTWVSVRH